MIDADLLYRRIRAQIKSIRTAEPDTRLTQEELGAVLGLKRSSVANLESGAQRASIHNIYELCDHFGLELHDVLPDIRSMRADTKAKEVASSYNVENHLVPIIRKLQNGSEQ